MVTGSDSLRIYSSTVTLYHGDHDSEESEGDDDASNESSESEGASGGETLAESLEKAAAAHKVSGLPGDGSAGPGS